MRTLFAIGAALRQPHIFAQAHVPIAHPTFFMKYFEGDAHRCNLCGFGACPAIYARPFCALGAALRQPYIVVMDVLLFANIHEIDPVC